MGSKMRFKKLLLAVCIPAFLSATTVHAETKTQAKKPNILLIVADDLGFSDTEPFGSEIKTPNIARLAKEGTTLTNFYAGPTCSVTRSMLLTGNDNHQAGMGNMAELLQPEQKGHKEYLGQLNDQVMTIAELLKQNGYGTYMAGKWHLGGAANATPYARGFEQSFALMQGGAAHMDKSSLFEGYAARYVENEHDINELPKGFYSTDFYTDKMLSYLKDNSHKNQPFFAYLAYTSPHWPLQAPEEYLKKYENSYKEGYEKIRQDRFKRMLALGIIPKGTKINDPLAKDFPSWEKLTPEQRLDQVKTMQIYAAMIDNLDHNIGRVLDYLRESGELDNTVVLFMSDNGAESSTPEALHEHGIRDWVDANFDNSYNNMGRKGSYVTLGPQWAQVASTPLPYFKGLVSNGGIHVPAIVRYPALTKAGDIEKDMVHVSDFVPTVMQIANIQRPDHFNGKPILPLQGRSFVPVLQGKTLPERSLGWEFNNKKALYRGDWVVQNQTSPYGTGNWELYNRKKDPSLLHDLATKDPKRTEVLVEEWQKYAKNVGVISAPYRFRYGQMTCLYDTCIQPDSISQ